MNKKEFEKQYVSRAGRVKFIKIKSIDAFENFTKIAFACGYTDSTDLNPSEYAEKRIILNANPIKSIMTCKKPRTLFVTPNKGITFKGIYEEFMQEMTEESETEYYEDLL